MFTLQFCNIASEKCLRFKKAVATRVCVARSGVGLLRLARRFKFSTDAKTDSKSNPWRLLKCLRQNGISSLQILVSIKWHFFEFFEY